MKTHTVRDRLWLWGHTPNRHTATEEDRLLWGIPGSSRMTLAEACVYLGLGNALMVTYRNDPEPPFHQEALALGALDRVVWSIVGDAGTTRTTGDRSDLDEVVKIADAFPNICGAIMDDFYHDGVPRQSPESLARFQRHLKGRPNPLDLWVVLYSDRQDLDIQALLDSCDVLTFWNMNASQMPRLASDMAAWKARTPGKRRLLGCYMWNYGEKKPMTIDQMRYQCRLGLQWLQDGTIEGMIFLASCICDLGLDAVEWTRRWISDNGDMEL